MPLLLLLHLLQLAWQPDVVAAPSPAQSTNYPWDAASGPGTHTRAAAAPTPADADEASSPWSAARRLLADVVGVGDPKCLAGSSPCPVHNLPELWRGIKQRTSVLSQPQTLPCFNRKYLSCSSRKNIF